MEDWYEVKVKQIETIGGLSLINYYFGASLPTALAKVFPGAYSPSTT